MPVSGEVVLNGCRKCDNWGDLVVHHGPEGWYVCCRSCEQCGKMASTPGGAIELWNNDNGAAPLAVGHGGGWVIGRVYLIRTVTMYQIGRLAAIDAHELTLLDAAWVADTGRFAEALRTGALREVEPYPDGPVLVGRGAIIDACEWAHGEVRKVIE